eukprot:Phypoly_transcript_02573.p1 GENE.Phypoly_transcript_02573~~Phypoly_transcript_02573.p1  ORF type:complete len:869 (+),score=165.71 Phypoly_transcript_02573:89-2695(+)
MFHWYKYGRTGGEHLFVGLKFLIRVKLEETSKVVDEIKRHGGGIADELSHSITHIVSSEYNSLTIIEKEAIKANTVCLVHPSWLLESISQGFLCSSDNFRERYMEGVVVTTAQLRTEDKALVAAWLALSGGSYVPEITESTTHLVTVWPKGEKYCTARASERPIFVVGVEWINACMASHSRQDEHLFSHSILEKEREKNKNQPTTNRAPVDFLCTEMEQAHLTGSEKMRLYNFPDSQSDLSQSSQTPSQPFTFPHMESDHTAKDIGKEQEKEEEKKKEEEKAEEKEKANQKEKRGKKERKKEKYTLKEDEKDKENISELKRTKKRKKEQKERKSKRKALAPVQNLPPLSASHRLLSPTSSLSSPSPFTLPHPTATHNVQSSSPELPIKSTPKKKSLLNPSLSSFHTSSTPSPTTRSAKKFKLSTSTDVPSSPQNHTNSLPQDQSNSPHNHQNKDFQFIPPSPIKPYVQRKRERDEDKCKLFMRGLVFVLGSCYTGILKTSIEDKLRASGAAIHEKVTSVTTHFLSQYTLSHSIPPGVVLVSSDWLHDALICQRVLPPSKPLHKPIPTKGVKGLEDAVICITGFVGKERADVKGLISASGAIHSGDFKQHNTHLICKYAEGKKYEKALEWRETNNVKIVNTQWILDTVARWQCADPDLEKYTVKNTLKRTCMLSGFTPTQRNELSASILALGGVLVDHGQFSTSATHLITCDLKPTEKVLNACAAGIWILKAEFLHASVKEGRFVEEEAHAWGEWAGKWRELNLLPFNNMCALISQPHIAALFHAGGGQVRTMPKEEGEIGKVDMVVLGKNEQLSKSMEQVMVAHHLKCVTSHFLVSWLISDKGVDMEKYTIEYDTQSTSQCVEVVDVD